MTFLANFDTCSDQYHLNLRFSYLEVGENHVIPDRDYDLSEFQYRIDDYIPQYIINNFHEYVCINSSKSLIYNSQNADADPIIKEIFRIADEGGQTILHEGLNDGIQVNKSKIGYFALKYCNNLYTENRNINLKCCDPNQGSEKDDEMHTLTFTTSQVLRDRCLHMY